MYELSPMMKQYIEIKNKYKDGIVFFRLGDFYEMFYEDASLVSHELDLTLTKKSCGSNEKAPMCGIPYHSCEGYIARLVEKGYKVVMCEQKEDPGSKNLFKREVTRVITPGTVLGSEFLDESRNNFICVLFFLKISVGVCFCDISTGELKFTQFNGSGFEEQLKNEITTFSPKEALISGDFSEKIKNFISKACVTSFRDSDVDFISKKEEITSFIKEKLNKDCIKSEQEFYVLSRCLSSLFCYINETQKSNLNVIKNIDIYKENEFMSLECGASSNLELFETIRTKHKKGSLMWVLDRTRTSMGRRLLRSWIEKPLRSVEKINLRLDAVDNLKNKFETIYELYDVLGKIGDVQRLLSKISFGSANCRDLKYLEVTIGMFPSVKNSIKNFDSTLIKYIYSQIDELHDVYNLINSSIVDEPPILTRDGGFIKKGFNSELDEILSDMNDGESVAEKIESIERKRTGIPKLKVGFNKVFGYYIEVSQSYKNLVPPDYIRKQTLAGRERYITNDLKNVESRIFSAKERSIKLENEILQDIKLKIYEQSDRISSTASAIAILDVLCSFAQVSLDSSFVRPIVENSDILDIKESRHPVVEKLLKCGESFVPNDISLDENNRVIVITGPNMAGKSTYMRQIALNVIMAQMGCFVASEYAKIGIIDSIFTRIGASDDVASGQSTFMIEMKEVAHITKYAGRRSLVLLDEIGRGTSTFDGLSIARAVLEFVARNVKCKTLFSTHYHEISKVSIDHVQNFKVDVAKNGDNIVFLRKIVQGSTDDSYGIEVAKLAGIPEEIILRARNILCDLENKKISVNDSNSKVNLRGENIIQKIKEIDTESITPIESMNILFSLSKMV